MHWSEFGCRAVTAEDFSVQKCYGHYWVLLFHFRSVTDTTGDFPDHLQYGAILDLFLRLGNTWRVHVFFWNFCSHCLLWKCHTYCNCIKGSRWLKSLRDRIDRDSSLNYRSKYGLHHFLLCVTGDLSNAADAKAKSSDHKFLLRRLCSFYCCSNDHHQYPNIRPRSSNILIFKITIHKCRHNLSRQFHLHDLQHNRHAKRKVWLNQSDGLHLRCLCFHRRHFHFPRHAHHPRSNWDFNHTNPQCCFDNQKAQRSKSVRTEDSK